MKKLLLFLIILLIYQFTFAQVKVKEDSLSYNSLKKLGNLYFSQKNYSKAKLYYSKLFPKLTNQEEKEKIYLQIEQCNYCLGNYESPTQVYFNFIQKFPNSAKVPEFRYKIALFFEQLKQYDRAITEYRILINKYSLQDYKVHSQQLTLDSLYYKIAILYNKQKNYNKSISILDTLIKNFPDSQLIDDAYQCKVDNYLADLDYRLAINLLVNLIEQDTTETSIKLYQQLADIYEKISVFEEMINIYQILRQYSKVEDKIIYYNKKIFDGYLKLQDYIEGIRFCNDVINENKGEQIVSALYYKGRMYQQLNDLDSAEFTFLFIINEFHNYKEWCTNALHSLSNLYIDNNENEKAFEIIRQLSEQDHDK